MTAPITEMPAEMRRPTNRWGSAWGSLSFNSCRERDALDITKRSMRFRGTLMSPWVVLAMMGKRQMTKATSITLRRPDPNHIRMSGAIATIGTVWRRMV